MHDDADHDPVSARARGSPPVPWSPEPVESLRARYPAALAYLYDIREVVAGAIRPAEVAASVFDFEGGVRLIVSRERGTDGDEYVHVSCSLAAGPVPDAVRKVCRTLPYLVRCSFVRSKFLQVGPEYFAKLAGPAAAARLELIGVSRDGEGIPHWHLRGVL